MLVTTLEIKSSLEGVMGKVTLKHLNTFGTVPNTNQTFGWLGQAGDLVSNEKNSTATDNYMLQKTHRTLTIYEGG